MTNDQIDQLCGAIRNALHFKNADAFEHVFGPAREADSFTVGVHRIADALEGIAGALDRLADAAYPNTAAPPEST